MAALRNFANPALPRRAAVLPGWQTDALVRKLWAGLQGYGRLRAAHHLERLASFNVPGDPVLARQLVAAAIECRDAASTNEGEGS
jgi:hypothetical protein